MHVFLTSALVGDEWSASHPGRLIPRGRAHGSQLLGGRLGSETGLCYEEGRIILPVPRLELRPLSHSARSQWLYRSYRADM
jgi:hypothetical protein